MRKKNTLKGDDMDESISGLSVMRKSANGSILASNTS